jgi:hypothetical protein
MSHLKDVKMTYLEHLITAIGYSIEALKASVIFLVHGIFPDYWVYTGSNIISNLHNALSNKRNEYIM